MLTTLKDIFRPTWKKILMGILVGAVLTLAAGTLLGLTRHGPREIHFVADVFLLPGAVLTWLGLADVARVLFIPLQFLYAYTLTCVGAHVWKLVLGNTSTK